MKRLLYCALLLCSLHVLAQTQTAAVTTLPSGIGRIDGKEAISGIAYTRLFLSAAAAPATSPPSTSVAIDLNLPTLTVQCTQAPNGKFRFELFVNFGGVTDIAYYPPWRPANRDDLFPPATQKINLTMEFLGYTKVKPVKRQFEKVLEPWGQLRYNPPAIGSTNLEEIAYYFQYLRALPTFRISDGTQIATFMTTPLLAQIHNEPLCHASGL